MSETDFISQIVINLQDDASYIGAIPAVTGTATGGDALTLTDSGATWTINAYKNYTVRITSGTGAGQVRIISSNTATALTVTVAFDPVPTTDTVYDIKVTTELLTALQDAVKQYSKDRPSRKAKEYTGDDTYEYAIPTDWVDGFSVAKSIEYPSGEQIPNYIQSDEWMLYRTTTTLKIRFTAWTPGSNEKFIFNYITVHTVTASASSIPDSDFYAVCDLATAYALKIIANKVIQEQESTFGADVTNRGAKTDRYSARAKEWVAKYERNIGRKDPEAAVVIKDYDPQLSFQEHYLTHHKIYR